MAYNNIKRKLINHLMGNGRSSLRESGEELDVSVTTVSNHLEDLEEDGRIKEYTPIIDYSSFGYTETCIILIDIDHSNPEGVMNEIIENSPQLITVYETTGDFDAMAIGKFTNTEDINAQVKEIQKHDGVSSTVTNMALNTLRENEQFKLPIEEDFDDTTTDTLPETESDKE